MRFASGGNSWGVDYFSTLSQYGSSGMVMRATIRPSRPNTTIAMGMTICLNEFDTAFPP